MKDNFSLQSTDYARFRPGYPDAMVDYILEITKYHKTAWDCATGNGQLALQLARHFERVFATDISASQLAQAPQVENIVFQQEPAEKTAFGDAQFDLITVAQAIHWFDFEAFYKEVYRCLQPEGLFVVAGYGLLKINQTVDQIINHLYTDIVGPYWDEERHYIDEAYKTIPFPFEELKAPDFVQTYQWSIDHLIGYLKTWSAVKHYSKSNNVDPVLIIEPELRQAWGDVGNLEVRFQVLFRAGRKYLDA